MSTTRWIMRISLLKTAGMSVIPANMFAQDREICLRSRRICLLKIVGYIHDPGGYVCSRSWDVSTIPADMCAHDYQKISIIAADIFAHDHRRLSMTAARCGRWSSSGCISVQMVLNVCTVFPPKAPEKGRNIESVCTVFPLKAPKKRRNIEPYHGYIFTFFSPSLYCSSFILFLFFCFSSPESLLFWISFFLCGWGTYRHAIPPTTSTGCCSYSAVQPHPLPPLFPLLFTRWQEIWGPEISIGPISFKAIFCVIIFLPIFSDSPILYLADCYSSLFIKIK
jgi:hypothetical protein